MPEAVREFQALFTVVDKATRQSQDITKKIKRDVDDATRNAKVAIRVNDQATAELLKIQAVAERVYKIFTQPLRITVADFAKEKIQEIGAALTKLRTMGIIPISLGLGGAAVGMGIGALGIAGIGYGIAKSVDDAANLEAAMIRVNKLVGFDEGLPGGKAAIKGLEDDIQRLMIDTGQTLGEVSAAYERAGAAGIGMKAAGAGDFEAARKEIEDYVKISLQASSAFNMSAESASQYLGTIANVYKPAEIATNDYLRSVASGIDAIADATLSSEEDLMIFLNDIAGATAQIKKSAEVDKFFLALGATIRGTGVSADEAGTMVERFLTRSEQHAADLSKQMGMTHKEFLTLLHEDPQKFFEAVTSYYQGLSVTKKADFAKVFGIEGGRLLGLTAGATWDEMFATAYEAGSPAYDAGVRIASSFEKSMTGLWPQVRKLVAAFTVLKQSIGTGPAIALTGILKVVNALVIPLVMLTDKIIALGGKIPGAKFVAGAVGIAMMAAVVKGLMILLGPVIAKLHLMANAKLILAMYTNIARVAMQGFSRATLAAMANPVVLVLALVAAVGFLLYKTGYLQKAWDKFVNSPVGEDVKALIAFLSKGAGAAWGAINARWEIMSPEVQKTLTSIADVLGGVFLWMVDLQLKYLETIIDIIKKIWSFGEMLWGWLSKIVTFLKDLPDKIREALPESIVGRSALEGSALAEAFKEEVRGTPGTTEDEIQTFLDYKAGKISGAEASASSIGGVTLEKWDKIWNNLATGTPSIATKTSGAVSTATSVETYTGAPKTTGEAVAQGTAAGFVPGFGLYKAAETGYNWLFGSDAAGSQYVPRTGPYLLHQGERVVPAAQNRLSGGSQSIIVNVPVHIDRVSSAYDERRLESTIRRAAKDAVLEVVAQRRT